MWTLWSERCLITTRRRRSADQLEHYRRAPAAVPGLREGLGGGVQRVTGAHGQRDRAAIEQLR
jgi:hypothetical protein